MRLLVLGAGGIGGYFGGHLAAAGADVTFLVRHRRAAQLATDGLVITSPFGDLRLPVRTVIEAERGFDAVILACKAYDLRAAMDAIDAAIDPATVILPLLNGLRHLDDLDRRFGPSQVLGGLCHIGVTMTPSGEVRHLNRLQHVALGAREPGQYARARSLHAALDLGGFAPQLSSDILQDMWEKYVFLASLAGMTCLMRASVGAIVATDAGRALMIRTLDECAAAARRAGHAPRPDPYATARAALTEAGSPSTASMLRDLLDDRPTEHDHIIGDMIDRAGAGNAPVLEIAYAHLQAHAATRAAATTLR